MDAQVIVVGAGPTGLMVATELQLRGVATIVVEKLAARNAFGKALSLQPRTTEILDLRGLRERVTGHAEGQIQGTHFWGVSVGYDTLDTRYPYQIRIPQVRLEEILEARLIELGGKVRRNWEVIGIEQNDHAIVVHGPRPLQARYLVACDGGHSTIRKLLALSFPGVEASEYFTMADIRLEAGTKALPALGGTWDATTMRRLRRTKPDGSAANLLPLGEPGQYRLLYNDGRTKRDDVTKPQLADAIQRFWGEDYELRDVMYAGRFGDTSRQLVSYRADRVLFAGDSAHIHLPAGGQGLNLGVQDAFNLGWKLAAVVNGAMPDAFLESYTIERHAVGARVLDNTRAQNALRKPDVEHQALMTIVARLLAIPEANKTMAAMIAGLDIEYGGSPPVGRRLPDFRVGAGWASDLFHAGTGVLISTGKTAIEQADRWSDRVACSLADALPWDGIDAVLVRPDGHVCWAAPDGPILAALQHWFGPGTPGPTLGLAAHSPAGSRPYPLGKRHAARKELA